MSCVRVPQSRSVADSVVDEGMFTASLMYSYGNLVAASPSFVRGLVLLQGGFIEAAAQQSNRYLLLPERYYLTAEHFTRVSSIWLLM